MFLKLLAIVLCAAGVAGALLVIRQQRIETAHDLVDVHRRLQARERALWILQNEVAERVRPAELRALMEPLDKDWRPIVAGDRPDRVELPALVPVKPDGPGVNGGVEPDGATPDPEALGG